MTNTKRIDWATIIDNNREALMDAFAEATALALRNGQDEFIVYLWADGETEIFQNTGNSYLEAEGLREIKGFRYVGWSPMDWYGDDSERRRQCRNTSKSRAEQFKRGHPAHAFRPRI